MQNVILMYIKGNIYIHVYLGNIIIKLMFENKSINVFKTDKIHCVISKSLTCK